jgi:hypothetical protein
MLLYARLFRLYLLIFLIFSIKRGISALFVPALLIGFMIWTTRGMKMGIGGKGALIVNYLVVSIH